MFLIRKQNKSLRFQTCIRLTEIYLLVFTSLVLYGFYILASVDINYHAVALDLFCLISGPNQETYIGDIIFYKMWVVMLK